ncbi:hypothetical protein MRX96_028147 [Rhipicephalus microplus]
MACVLPCAVKLQRRNATEFEKERGRTSRRDPAWGVLSPCRRPQRRWVPLLEPEKEKKNAGAGCAGNEGEAACVIYTRVRERRRFPGKLIASPGARWTPPAARDREHLFHPPCSLSRRARRPCLDCAQLAPRLCAGAVCVRRAYILGAVYTDVCALIYARAGRGRCHRAGSKRLVWPDKRRGGAPSNPWVPGRLRTRGGERGGVMSASGWRLSGSTVRLRRCHRGSRRKGGRQA